MKKENFTYSFQSSKTPGEIFDLLLNIEQWWSGFYEETINGKSEKVNDEFTFRAGEGAHYTRQKLVELDQNKKIAWLVTDSNLTFLSDPTEWIGTKICFDISAEHNKTKVTFTHEGLVPEVECYDQCSNGWTNYLGKLKGNLK
jgi:hypothetical protein